MKTPRIHTPSAWSRFVHSPITLGVCVLVTLYTSSIIFTQWKKERLWNARAEDRAIDVRAARDRHDTLKARVAYAESDAGKEEYIRQSFDVAQKGESLVILPETKKEEIVPDELELPEEKSWWQKFIAKILNI
ncbi:hypothetical protein A3C87_03070 [Candidatus Kaiserbacteria bacterium RIFCSPHIGHO2_02_FULL_49_34]|uniref:Septum formation initiator n=1 Tax=Candidatus Kaiserbacteria bacterium RIFCSPHIGHO2_02_FULL_49_34 TaxID=1798491 RepID=A0A1F6DI96_9BACT|nr:MAG: hypothetical protein A3C87_03070 [Candidatus Kaiserbacteria bacterium RIFCSPHIGHO2_02_FULL_49_34]